MVIAGVLPTSFLQAVLNFFLQVLRLGPFLFGPIADGLVRLFDFIVDIVFVVVESGNRSNQTIPDALILPFLLHVLGLLVEMKLLDKGPVGVHLN